MSKRIKCLAESPCYKCNMTKKCDKKVEKNPIFKEIVDFIMPNADYSYKDCGIWISLMKEKH